MNVTEPLPTAGSYYPEPVAPNKPSTTGGWQYADFYDDPDVTPQSFRDIPLESTSNPVCDRKSGPPDREKRYDAYRYVFRLLVCLLTASR